MTSPLVTGGAIAVGSIMIVVGTLSLGSLSSPAFDYEKATDTERTAFLKSSAGSLGKSLRRSLVSPSGVGTKFRMTGTEVDTDRRQITFVIKASNDFDTTGTFYDAKIAMFKKACPAFVSGPLGRNDVKVVQSFIGKDDYVLDDVEVSNSVCDRYR